MKDLIAKLKDPKTKAAFKSYVRAVIASAITMGLALAADLAPEQAILIGALAAPLAKWADKTEKEKLHLCNSLGVSLNRGVRCV
jgi:hypothetical protein